MSTSPSPSLASLLAAVRAHAPLATWQASMDDAALSEVVRTARTVKGALWLATRTAGPQEDAAKQLGQAATAMACLAKLAALGDPRAKAAMAAWQQADDQASADLTAELEREIAAQV